jgi:LysM repeat protein
MTEALQADKATLRKLDADGNPTSDPAIPVQFNPETLKVSYSNQIVQQNTPASSEENTGQSQPTGSAKTTLTVQLWLDVTAPLPEGLNFGTQENGDSAPRDVRRLTRQISDFMRPAEGERVPPPLRFQWGTFQFDGLMESVEESLEFFSPKGVPLRASLNISMSQQSLSIAFASLNDTNDVAGAETMPGGAPSGTQPTATAQEGSTMQSVAERENIPKGQVKNVARQNNIENLRRLQPGQRIDTSIPQQPQQQRETERTQQSLQQFARERNLPDRNG